jgi:hypothetical protein
LPVEDHQIKTFIRLLTERIQELETQVDEILVAEGGLKDKIDGL